MAQKSKKDRSGTYSIWIMLFIGLNLLGSVLSIGEEKEEDKEKSWKYFSSTSFSLVMAKGNSESLSYSFDTEQNLHIKKNRINLKAHFIKAKSDGEKTSEMYYSHLKYDRKVNTRAYVLGFARYEQNKLAGYNYRIAFSGGVGATWIDQKKIIFSTELALGWNNENNSQRVVLKDVNNDSSVWKKTISAAFLSSIIANKLVYKMSKTTQLMFQETIFINMKDTKDFRLNSYSSISAAISPQLALKTSIQILFEHRPVKGYKNTDVFLLSSLVLKI